MGFPSINGAAINAEEGAGILIEGLDIVRTPLSTHTAYAVGSYAGAHPLELGDFDGIEFQARPPGLEMVSQGTHLVVYNASITPAGIEMVSAGVGRLEGVFAAPGTYPLEIGAHRIQQGVDVAISPVGLDIVRAGLHMAHAGMPPPAFTFSAPGARPLELGQPRLVLGGLTAQAPGFYPLTLGQPGTRFAGIAPGAYPLEIGGLGSPVTAYGAPGTYAMELGTPSVHIGLPVTGIEMVRAGQHAVVVGGVAFEYEGAYPLELGDLDAPPRVTARAPQHFPMQMGHHSVQREATC